MTPAAATRRLIVATVVAWLAYDLVVVAAYGRGATISRQMYLWSLEYAWFAPAVTLGLLLLCFHFFGPPWRWRVFRGQADRDRGCP